MKKVALLLFAPIFLGAFQTNDEWKDKVAPELLARAEAGETVELIVLLREQADVSAARLLTTKEARANYVWQTLQQTAGRTQAGLVAELSGKGVEFRSYYLINALWVRADLDVLRSIAQRPEVSRLQVNDPVEVEEPIEETPVTTRGPDAIEWGIERINADDVWAMGYTGQGVIVGGQDTGYEWDHPALKTQYRGWDGTAADHNYNWHDAIHEINPLNNDSIVSPTNNPCGLDSAVPCDDSGHGTHTMGTMIGEDGDNQIGVAPGARWIACRNMERGYGSPATYIECFEWFLAPTDLNGQNPDPSKAPHVINNSWSCPELEGCNPDNFAFMQTAVDNLKASGVVVVVSAGNSGS
ncbi:MAG: S8 family serine peptidase, partial [Saprospiraceae bacterium]|nr:S8 family serine peptidase [Saprospiraceae bacterium]